MGNVLRADGSIADAWVEADLDSDPGDFWTTWEEMVEQATFDNGITTNFVTVIWDDDETMNIAAGIDNALWTMNSDTVTGGTVPGGSTWIGMELHRVPGGTSELYIDGVLVLTGDDPNPGSDIQFVRAGYFNGLYQDPNVTFIKNFKVGTTRGDDDLFSWPDTETDLSAWASTEGDVSVVADPAVAPPPPPEGVCIAFDDPTLEPAPAWTRLDSDGSGAIVQTWSIARGRPSEFDKIGAGTATVTIHDRTGTLDPTNTAGPWYGKILPLKQAAIALYNPVAEEWMTIFRGYVEDWTYSLDITETFMMLTLELVDGFDILAAAELRAGVDGDSPPAGSESEVFYEDTAGSVQDRILAVLGDVEWPIGTPPTGLTEVFSGNVKVQETIYADRTPGLTALQDAADAEFPMVANAYMSKDGLFTFHGRQARFRPDVADYHIAHWKVGDLAAHTGDSDTVLASGIDFNLGKDKIINSAAALPQGIATADVAAQLREDSTSISTYGTRSWSAENLLTLEGIATGNDPLEETALFADYAKVNFKDPHSRVGPLVIRSRAPGTIGAAKCWQLLCGIDISDLVTVTSTHPGGGGGFNAEDFYVEGLQYEAAPMNATHLDVTLTLDVSPRALFNTNPFDADPDV